MNVLPAIDPSAVVAPGAAIAPGARIGANCRIGPFCTIGPEAVLEEGVDVRPVPLGRTVSPVTKTNWEGVGVAPDVGVCAADALRTAQVAILTDMAASRIDPDEAGRLKERLAELGGGSPASAGCP